MRVAAEGLAKEAELVRGSAKAHGFRHAPAADLNSRHSRVASRAMEAARVLPVTVADYLAQEDGSAVRHEYVAGDIHAMSGGSRAHNRITGNIYASLRARLRGGPCQVFINDFKVRLQVAGAEFFYYPDVLVSCHPGSIEKYYLTAPTLVVEVLSESTETIDRREKLTNYRHAASLEEYVLVAQDRREVTIFRRATGWQGEMFTEPAAAIELRSIKQTIAVREIYEDVL